MTVPSPLPRLLATLLLAPWVAGCGGPDTDVRTASSLHCDVDASGDDAKDVVERVGGLVTDDFTVKFAKGTEIGVVALVDGDVDRAFQVLRDDYGVVAVAQQDPGGDPGTVSGFTQVQQIVDHACG